MKNRLRFIAFALGISIVIGNMCNSQRMSTFTMLTLRNIEALGDSENNLDEKFDTYCDGIGSLICPNGGRKVECVFIITNIEDEDIY